MIRIKVIPVKLLDGSRVFDLHIADEGAEPMVLNAHDRQAACNLAQKITDAINIHTNDEARWYEVDYYQVA